MMDSDVHKDYTRCYALYGADSDELEKLSRWCMDGCTQNYLTKNPHSSQSTIIRGRAFHRFRRLIQQWVKKDSMIPLQNIMCTTL